MHKVSVEQLVPGQVLAEALTTAAGVMLCPAGFQLTESAIERIKKAGVQTVAIEGAAVSAPEVERRIEALRQRFEGVDDPMLLELKRVMEARLEALLIP